MIQKINRKTTNSRAIIWEWQLKLFMKIKYILFLVLIIYSCTKQKSENAIVLIPKGYTGPLLIIFNQTDGEPKEYEADKRLYRIPYNGILRTQFEPNYSLQKQEYYYIDKNGERTVIPFVNLSDEKMLSANRNSDKIFVYGNKAIGEGLQVTTKNDKKNIPPAQSFYIGSLLDTVRSAIEQRDFIFKNQQ